MEIEGMSLTVPLDVIETARAHPEMSRDERIKLVADTEWCVNTASSMCETLFAEGLGTEAHLECLNRVTDRIAAKIID
jgi:TusA-related sulfurtransferase